MKRIAKWVGIAVALLIVAVLSLPLVINVDQFRPALQTELSSMLGRQVTLGNLRLNILSGEVTAEDFAVAEDPAFGKPAFLHAKSLHVGAEILPFILARKLIVTYLLLDQPQIALVQSPSGEWNFSSLGAKSAVRGTPSAQPSSAAHLPLDLSAKLIKIKDGGVRVSRTVGHWKPVALQQMNLEVHDYSSASAFPFALAAQVRGGGTVKLDGTAGPINLTDSAMTPVKVSLKVAQLDLAGSGVTDVAPHLAGLASVDGSGESDGVTMRLQGKLKADKLKLAKNGSPATRPVEMDFSVQHDLRKHTGAVNQGDIHIGAAAAHLSGTYAEQGDSMVVNFKFSGSAMPLQELEGLMPAAGVVLPAGTSLKGGNASANVAMQGPADRLVTTGSLVVNNTRLVGFDLNKKMSPIEKLAGIKAGPDMEIQVLSTNLRVAPEGLSAQDVKMVLPAIGEVTGAGTVSPANALNFKMSAVVHTSGVLAVMGNKPIPFAVEGTAADPVFKPDLKAIAAGEIKGVGGDVGKVAGGLVKLGRKAASR